MYSGLQSLINYYCDDRSSKISDKKYIFFEITYTYFKNNEAVATYSNSIQIIKNIRILKDANFLRGGGT